MKVIVTLILLMFGLSSSNFIYGFKQYSKAPKKYQERDDVLELIAKAGYKGEAHTVETEDGYFLKVHRLLPKQWTNKRPVFLQHGLMATAADFIIIGPTKAIAYLLSDYGYDVWLGNVRGSKHSRGHRNLAYLSDDYWRFSFHEVT